MWSGKGLYTLIRFNKTGTKLVLGGENTDIRRGCSIVMPYANSIMTIKSGVVVNQETMLYCGKELYIGDNTRIGWKCQIYDNNFHFVYDKITV